MQYIILFLSIIIGVIGQIFLKKGMMVIGVFHLSNIVKIFFNPFVFIGFLFYGISSVMWLYSLSKFELNTIYPLLSLGYIFTMIAGYYLFNESITIYKVISILLICSGVILMGVKSA